MRSNYTIVIVKNESWYAGYVKELPGAHSQGKTVEEVRENMMKFRNFCYSHRNLSFQ